MTAAHKLLAGIVLTLLVGAMLSVGMARRAQVEADRKAVLDAYAVHNCRYDGQELDGPYGIRMTCHAKLKSHS